MVHESMIYFLASPFLFHNRGDVGPFVDRLSFKSPAVTHESSCRLGDGGPGRPITHGILGVFLNWDVTDLRNDHAVILPLASTQHRR
jgi:hypothetical protein